MTVVQRDDAMDIGDWLRELALPEYEAVFRANAVDLQALRELTEIDLEKLGAKAADTRDLIAVIAVARS